MKILADGILARDTCVIRELFTPSPSKPRECRWLIPSEGIWFSKKARAIAGQQPCVTSGCPNIGFGDKGDNRVLREYSVGESVSGLLRRSTIWCGAESLAPMLRTFSCDYPASAARSPYEPAVFLLAPAPGP